MSRQPNQATKTPLPSRLFEQALTLLFPPRLGRIDGAVVYRPGEHAEPLGDGVLWRAYDVRQDAIERHWREVACSKRS